MSEFSWYLVCIALMSCIGYWSLRNMGKHFSQAMREQNELVEKLIGQLIEQAKITKKFSDYAIKPSGEHTPSDGSAGAGHS